MQPHQKCRPQVEQARRRGLQGFQMIYIYIADIPQFYWRPQQDKEGYRFQLLTSKEGVEMMGDIKISRVCVCQSHTEKGSAVSPQFSIKSQEDYQQFVYSSKELKFYGSSWQNPVAALILVYCAQILYLFVLLEFYFMLSRLSLEIITVFFPLPAIVTANFNGFSHNLISFLIFSWSQPDHRLYLLSMINYNPEFPRAHLILQQGSSFKQVRFEYYLYSLSRDSLPARQVIAQLQIDFSLFKWVRNHFQEDSGSIQEAFRVFQATNAYRTRLDGLEDDMNLM